MSYIVKSRDFPKFCSECDELHLCCDFYYCGVGYQKDGRNFDINEHYFNKTKHPDCPLLELPKKHGRLIDAEKLLIALTNDSHGLSAEQVITIMEFPTIIEAEVSE